MQLIDSPWLCLLCECNPRATCNKHQVHVISKIPLDVSSFNSFLVFVFSRSCVDPLLLNTSSIILVNT